MKIKINCEYAKLENINSLKPHPKNRNVHSKEQVEMVSKLLKYQGWRHPILISNLSGLVVAGHCRLLSAKKLGLKTVPVDYQDFDNDEQEYSFIQSDNASALWADLDIKSIIDDIKLFDKDFDFSLLGIENFLIDSAQDIQKVNSGDENSEWIGLPEFNSGDDSIKLIIHFSTEKDREKYCKLKNIIPSSKRNKQWIVNEKK